MFLLCMLYYFAVFNLKLLVCICFKSLFFRTLPLAPSGGDRWFYADRKYQRPLRMVAFLTQNVVDVFGVSGIRHCLIDNACSNRSCGARVATGKHCQLWSLTARTNRDPHYV